MRNKRKEKESKREEKREKESGTSAARRTNPASVAITLTIITCPTIITV